jgi:hypothetical protein
MARNRLAAGEVAAAGQALETGLQMSARHGHCTTCDALLLPVAVSVRAATGDFRTAESFCQRLEEAAEQYASRLWLAMARQSRGELAAAQSQIDAALSHYTEAQAGFASTGNEYEVARCLDAIAKIRIERGLVDDIAPGQDAQKDARRIFRRLGAT